MENMGNLRDKYTDAEWEQFEKNLEKSPRNSMIGLFLVDKSLDELIELKKVLLNFYSEYQLNLLNEWIEYKKL